MAGFDDDNSSNNNNNNNNNVGAVGDWVPPCPSPRSLLTRMLGSDEEKGSKPISESSVGCNSGGLLLGSQDYTGSEKAEKKDWGQAGQKHFDGVASEQKPATRGGLSERLLARAGFTAPRLNTENIRSLDLSANPDSSSHFLTISPGLSPATLLDSPVFLSNSSVQPSPTTGKYSCVANEFDSPSFLSLDNLDKCKDTFFEDINFPSFALKCASPSSPSYFQGATSKVEPANLPHQSLPRFGVSVESDNLHKSHSLESLIARMQNRENLTYQGDPARSLAENHNRSHAEPGHDTAGPGVELSPSQDDQQEEEQRCSGSDDGYNWRKYGQKQVKGSEYPRSYYKCTHPNCLVKKKVERSPEGHITEIIYKGSHNHDKPPPSRRSALGLSTSGLQAKQDAPRNGIDNTSVWSNAQQVGAGGNPELRHDNIEVTSSASMGFEHAQNGHNRFESADGVDVSSTFSNDEGEDDLATHGSVSLGYDGEEEESEPKRRRLETYAGASRAVREPRIVVQTTSDVDILDDGYRWRKYGQKVVKGNPNPRSYYKCTSAGCTVRKHVERASHDLKSVITTYEGKHNHDVPAARNSSHSSSGATTAQASPPVQAHARQPEPPQVHARMPRFERPVPFTPFGLQLRQQLGTASAFSLGLSQPGFPNLSVAGLVSNQTKLPVLPMHPYLPQQPRVGEMGFMLPKGDPKMEPAVSEPELPMMNGTSLYQQIMSRLPLGPQM